MPFHLREAEGEDGGRPSVLTNELLGSVGAELFEPEKDLNVSQT